MKVLVNGGAGMIGMALRRLLAPRGHHVIATDLTDFGRNDPQLVLLPLSDHAGHEQLVVDGGIGAIVHGGGIFRFAADPEIVR